MNKFLSGLYYNPGHPAGFSTVDKLYKASKAAGKKYTREQVENYLLKQDTYSLHKPQRLNYPTRKTVARGLHETHQADLADFSRHAKYNPGCKFVLVVVDVLSKKAYAEALQDKSNSSVVAAFEAIYSKGRAPCPLNVGTDKGKEFLGSVIQAYFRKEGIHHYTLENRQKAAVAERFIRTLKSKIYKYMDSIGSEKFADKLQEFMSAYNASYHRSIKMTPDSVNMENAASVAETLYGKVVRKRIKVDSKYKTGDRVRISEHRYTFQKGYEQNYTDEIFTVARVLRTKPVSYKLKDVYGENVTAIFYTQELVKVIVDKNKRYRIEYVVREKRVKGKKQFLVKFRGYSKPEWISQLPKDL